MVMVQSQISRKKTHKYRVLLKHPLVKTRVKFSAEGSVHTAWGSSLTIPSLQGKGNKESCTEKGRKLKRMPNREELKGRGR